MIAERISELIARKLGKAASAAELQELEELLAQHPEYRFMEEIIHSLESSRHIAPQADEQEISASGWEELSHRLAPDAAPLRRRLHSYGARWWVAAAVLVLIVTGAGLLWREKLKKPAAPELTYDIVAKLGGTTKAVLPDGTRIWLNAGSKLSYGNNFMEQERSVTLYGEAFFDVVKDDTKPFIVHTENFTVKVLGTAFNVRAYKDDRKVETAVIEGKVQVVMRNNPEKKVVLLRHEKLILSLDETLPVAQAAAPLHHPARFQVQGLANGKDSSLVVETAWKDQKLAFMNETFEEVARKMERQFDVTIHFENEALKQEILSGVFEKEDISKALQLLQMTTGFHYRIEGQDVYLSE